MEINGRLSDALNRREAIAITDVSWGPPESGAQLDAAPGLKSVDPYDLILVTAGEDSLPPLTETERAAIKVHKVAYDVALEVPPFRVVGTVYLHPGSEPERLLDRSTEMFVPVVDAIARLGDAEVSDPDVEIILVNRFYLRGVSQVDKRTGEPHPRLPGQPLGGTSWQDAQLTPVARKGAPPTGGGAAARQARAAIARPNRCRPALAGSVGVTPSRRSASTWNSWVICSRGAMSTRSGPR